MRLSLKERRMMFDNASNFYRKSGVAQWRDLRLLFFDQPYFSPFTRYISDSSRV
jgi:hypothetical protein